MQYIAFLRGINIGGRKVLMEDLQRVFQDIGCEDVKTFITSGNVQCTISETNEETLCRKLEDALEKKFGFPIPVILRSKEDLQELVQKDPFKDVLQEKGTRLHVTFFSEDLTNFEAVDMKGFHITVVGKRELASVVDPEGKTTELMTCIDKIFGKNCTTRNWSTILKLV